MNEYLNSDELKDRRWIEIIRTCRRLLEKEIEERNNRRVVSEDD